MSGATLLDASASAASLPAGLRREPRVAGRTRPATFLDAFDATSFSYDCFWHVDGRRVLLVGPPPVNLDAAYRAASFVALPGRAPLSARFHMSRSVMVIALEDVPDGTHSIGVRLGGDWLEVPVRPNLSPALAGRRVLFSMNKDNDPAWVREWASFHARHHGTDAVVLFDNGSTRYPPEALAEALRGVDGLATIAVPVWPQRFGRTDAEVRVDPYWAHFLQIASMGVVLRRFGAIAGGLLNCDIDELARPLSGTTIYEAAARSRAGLAVFSGQWIETASTLPVRGDHRDYRARLDDPKRALSRPRKWALDPRRDWVRHLRVHPYWHWIEGRPAFSKSTPRGAGYWHFRAINTNWKSARTAPRETGAGLETDAALAAAFAEEEMS